MQYKIDLKYKPSSTIVFECNDALKFTKKLPGKSIQLIITSPPYNIGKIYENRTSIQEYLNSQQNIIKELVRVLSDKGSICWQVGNYVDKGEVFPLDIYYYKIFKECGLKLKNRIIWHFEHGLHANNRFSGRYETILWFTKSDKHTFNLDDVRVPSKYPGKKYYKGPNKGKLSGNPLGKNPSDFWTVIQNYWNNEVWNIPNVKSNHPEKTTHPCQFPVELIERCVLALSNEGDIVYDPYAGVASSIIAAIKHNRRAYGADHIKNYVDIGIKRIRAELNGTLKTRPLGKTIHSPRGKIAQFPEEWKKGA